MYLEPAHVEKVLHESEDWKYVEVSNEPVAEASTAKEACDHVDIDGQCNHLSHHYITTSTEVQTQLYGAQCPEGRRCSVLVTALNTTAYIQRYL